MACTRFQDTCASRNDPQRELLVSLRVYRQTHVTAKCTAGADVNGLNLPTNGHKPQLSLPANSVDGGNKW
eukprot:scaffold2857_cov399-Prasinococcus_capsulatus_cf.AAC.6